MPGFQSPVARAQHPWSPAEEYLGIAVAPRGNRSDARRQGRSSSEWEKPVARSGKKPDWNNKWITMTTRL